ncbi:MAG: NfeD family protein [Actinomycetota bacterium]|nr:NfeD family protein [Actinomycetota bacterium]
MRRNETINSPGAASVLLVFKASHVQKEADVDVLTQYAWIVWLVLILAFATIEVFTLEMTFLMLALGSVAGLVSGLFGIPWWVQFIIAAVVSGALILMLRPPLLRMLRRGDSTRSAIDALVGSEGYVMREVTPSGGRIRLADGEVWSARLSPITEQAAVPIGASVLVTGVDGATAVVVAIERSTDA